MGGEKGEMDFPFASYPADVQTKFGPFGQGHKLGDAAAGRSGSDAEEAIIKVNAGLLNGDWSTRAPAVPKVKVSDIIANFANLSAKEKATAAPLLAALGIRPASVAVRTSQGRFLWLSCPHTGVPQAL